MKIETIYCDVCRANGLPGTSRYSNRERVWPPGKEGKRIQVPTKNTRDGGLEYTEFDVCHEHAIWLAASVMADASNVPVNADRLAQIGIEVKR